MEAAGELEGESMKKQVIQVRMDKADIARLKREADKAGHTVSSLARQVLKMFLAETKADGSEQ